MAKTKKLFQCNGCGYESASWLGRCPSCGLWNTLIEVENNPVKSDKKETKVISAVSLADLKNSGYERFTSGNNELDILLGGGVVPGSAVLIGGEPGIGKSTLLLQISDTIVQQNKKVLYITAEESLSQLKMRAERLKINNKELFLSPTGDTNEIVTLVKKIKPAVIIVDSIQSIRSDNFPGGMGSISQVRGSASTLIGISKQENIALFITGHVTKDGTLSGPKTLEHVVDTVLYFEGSRDRELRIIRSVKNRFGSVNEIGVFLMTAEGLSQIDDPTAIFLDSTQTEGQGASLTATMEGNRALIAEIQALVTDHATNNISRTIDGIPPNRVLRVKAVIDKTMGIDLQDRDIFINVTGGLNIQEPAVDLAIAVAIISSFRNKKIKSRTIFFGEISLLGKLRRVPQAEKRIMQAKKLGMKTAIIPTKNRKDCEDIKGIEIIYADNLADVFTIIFSN